MNLVTLKAIVMATRCTSKDATRHQINRVKIAPGTGERVRITATNGHMLSDQLIYDPGLLKLLDGAPVFAGPESFGALSLIYDLSKEAFLVPARSIDDPEPSLEIGLHDVFVRLSRSLGAEYPDVDQVYPKERKRSVKISLDAAYLLRIAKCGASDARHPRVTLEFDADALSNPIQVFALGQKETIGVLMPCHG